MRVEVIPLILGAIAGLLGLGLLFDAWTPDDTVIPKERRRRERAERSRGGEAFVGFGVLGMAAAFIGRDAWAYSTVAVIAGAVCLIGGAIANRSYLRQAVAMRGPARRRDPKP